ncbi:hypothetical protein JR316_0006187 [Psilocybe cubensis]|uniref:Uncharacterized protein n=1 Tax=Psilocybe cubensis TaxID=181762 RepID=A0ACB8H0Y2_PSICU|nr:hypothetical protein JR316_0006187 [Psilocybe cubensis]KAH9481660.1 hypothetical protein JR316_0006187 [Psilocybe cubensis]
MVRCLRQAYGYLPNTNTNLPLAPSDWHELVETFGFLGAHTKEVGLGDQQGIYQFYFACIEPTSVEMPASLSDLNSYSVTALSHILDLSQIHRPHPNFYVFEEPRAENVDWKLAVETAEIALCVCRLKLEHSWARIDTLAKMLLERGVPCRTVTGLHMSGRSTTVQQQYTPRSVRPTGYTFGLDDFETYRFQCENIIKHQPHGRAALLMGGLIGRIASEYLSVDRALNGPSREILENRQGFVLSAGNTNWFYCDDQLTENELAIICGTYTLYTAQTGQTTVKSWFPPANLWKVPATQNGTQWVEWTPTNEAWYLERVEAILTRQAQPLTRVQWKTMLRGTPPSRKLQASASQRAQALINAHVSVVPSFNGAPGEEEEGLVGTWGAGAGPSALDILQGKVVFYDCDEAIFDESSEESSSEEDSDDDARSTSMSADVPSPHPRFMGRRRAPRPPAVRGFLFPSRSSTFCAGTCTPSARPSPALAASPMPRHLLCRPHRSPDYGNVIKSSPFGAGRLGLGLGFGPLAAGSGAGGSGSAGSTRTRDKLAKRRRITMGGGSTMSSPLILPLGSAGVGASVTMPGSPSSASSGLGFSAQYQQQQAQTQAQQRQQTATATKPEEPQRAASGSARAAVCKVDMRGRAHAAHLDAKAKYGLRVDVCRRDKIRSN